MKKRNSKNFSLLTVLMFTFVFTFALIKYVRNNMEAAPDEIEFVREDTSLTSVQPAIPNGHEDIVDLDPRWRRMIVSESGNAGTEKYFIGAYEKKSGNLTAIPHPKSFNNAENCLQMLYSLRAKLPEADFNLKCTKMN